MRALSHITMHSLAYTYLVLSQEGQMQQDLQWLCRITGEVSAGQRDCPLWCMQTSVATACVAAMQTAYLRRLQGQQTRRSRDSRSWWLHTLFNVISCSINSLKTVLRYTLVSCFASRSPHLRWHPCAAVCNWLPAVQCPRSSL